LRSLLCHEISNLFGIRVDFLFGRQHFQHCQQIQQNLFVTPKFKTGQKLFSNKRANQNMSVDFWPFPPLVFNDTGADPPPSATRSLFSRDNFITSLFGPPFCHGIKQRRPRVFFSFTKNVANK
jgi:hypothetical protein